MNNYKFADAMRLAAIGKANYHNGIAKGLEMAVEALENADGLNDAEIIAALRNQAAMNRTQAHAD